MSIEYREVVGYPEYRVDSTGRVWSHRSSRYLVPVKLGRYWAVGLTRNGKRRLHYVHRIVLEAFVGPCPEGQQACHAPDPNTANNVLENLRWDTPRANNADKKRQGTWQGGERNGRAKLSEADVRAIRASVAVGSDYRAPAARYGVSPTMIGYVVRGHSWKHIAASVGAVADGEKDKGGL